MLFKKKWYNFWILFPSTRHLKIQGVYHPLLTNAPQATETPVVHHPKWEVNFHATLISFWYRNRTGRWWSFDPGWTLYLKREHISCFFRTANTSVFFLESPLIMCILTSFYQSLSSFRWDDFLILFKHPKG